VEDWCKVGGALDEIEAALTRAADAPADR